MQRKNVLTLLLIVLIGGGIFYGAHAARHGARVEHTAVVDARAAQVEQAESELSRRVPVPNNRGPEIPDGFRGEVHPLLHGHAELEVKAYWDCQQVKMSDLFYRWPADLDPARRLYLGARVAVPTRSYTERDFSPLLPPASVQAAGQLWALEPERVAVFLKQFHPAVSAHSAAVGRRPGPDGAFAVLRAVSSSHLDIVFRAHAEFDLAPPSAGFPVRHAWYTPACFLGRIVVNRRTGTVEYFRLGVPTDEVMNIHATVWITPDSDHSQGYGGIYQFLRAERMELVGGSLQGLDGVHWADQVETSRAYDQLAKVFYKFREIDFVPFPQALATARARKKPIFAVVPLGALDDQSC